jgi:hypothetical protein
MITKKSFCPSESTSFFFRRKKSTSSQQDTNSIHSHDDNNNTPPSPPRLTRRSLSPSELHYFTSHPHANSPFLPLEIHYASHQNLLNVFDYYQSNKKVEVAYGIGLKYVEVALLYLPRHSYYECYAGEEKRRSLEEARRVIGWLEEVVGQEEAAAAVASCGGDATNATHVGNKREVLQQLAVVAQRSYKEIAKHEKSNDESKETACSSWRDYVLDGTSNLCALLESLDYCGSLESVMEVKEEEKDATAVDLQCDARVTTSEVKPNSNISHEKEKAIDAKDSTDTQNDENRSQIEIKSSNSSSVVREAAPDTIIPTSNSYEQPQKVESGESIRTERADTVARATTTSTDKTTTFQEPQPTTRQHSDHSYSSDGFDRDELALALTLSKQEYTSSFTAHETNSQSLHHSKSISNLTEFYHQQFHTLVSQNKFHIRFIDTYQGRIPGSTNGCTVIAPLICIQYFITPESDDDNNSYTPPWKGGIHDEHVQQVIDLHAPSILHDVRTKLNLPPDSFIIPSDVHDHLLEVGLLSPTSFVGVCGGNILNEEHLRQLKHSLLLTLEGKEKERLSGRKIASPMFFHGHVVALHVIRKDEEVWIELIDSLPNREAWMMQKVDDSCFCEGREPEEEKWDGQQRYNSEEELSCMNAVRIRCTDVNHFETLLRHYALSKFSSEERKFIDENEWDDNNSYFDPRVFQAFIWSEAD